MEGKCVNQLHFSLVGKRVCLARLLLYFTCRLMFVFHLCGYSNVFTFAFKVVVVVVVTALMVVVVVVVVVVM